LQIQFAAILGSESRSRQIANNILDIFSKASPFCAELAGSRRMGKIVSAHYSCKNPIFEDGCFFENDREYFSFSGVPLYNFGEKYQAKDIHGIFANLGAAHFRNTVSGTYSVISACDDRIIAVTDPCGRYPIFYARKGDEIFICNYPPVFSYIDSEFAWHLNGQAGRSLAVHAQIWGSETCFKSVRLLDPRQVHLFEEGNKTSSEIDFNWHDFGGEYPLGPGQYAEAAESVLNAFKAIGHLMDGKPVNLGLSGGKDSRVMAAYAKKAGLNVSFFTSGISGSPEFGVAQQVAGKLGTVTEIRETDPAAQAPNLHWDGFRYHVGRYHAQLLPTAGSKGPHRGAPNVEITGFGGEIYRRGISKQFVSAPIRNWPDARNRWPQYHVPQDALGMLTPQVGVEDTRWMGTWVGRARPG
jgi:hypothetical protein